MAWVDVDPYLAPYLRCTAVGRDGWLSCLAEVTHVWVDDDGNAPVCATCKVHKTRLHAGLEGVAFSDHAEGEFPVAEVKIELKDGPDAKLSDS